MGARAARLRAVSSRKAACPALPSVRRQDLDRQVVPRRDLRVSVRQDPLAAVHPGHWVEVRQDAVEFAMAALLVLSARRDALVPELLPDAFQSAVPDAAGPVPLVPDASELVVL